jgi:hypothetical protein
MTASFWAYPHPGCFLQEWQIKDLSLTRLVRVAGKELKVAGFSMNCKLAVRVASKGLAERLRSGGVKVPEWEWKRRWQRNNMRDYSIKK